jgi:PIN domain nuclease of toxin-antitoxin system
MTARTSRRTRHGMPKPDLGVVVVLDTHAMLWWQAGSDRLSARAMLHIEHARSLLISPISCWEVAMLVQKRRIVLDRPTLAWVGDFLRTDRVEVAEVTPALAVAAAELSGFHGDPADRLIVATALTHGAALITKDGAIASHAARSSGVEIIW